MLIDIPAHHYHFLYPQKRHWILCRSESQIRQGSNGDDGDAVRLILAQ